MPHVLWSVSGPLFKNWWCSFTSSHYDRIYISHSVFVCVRAQSYKISIASGFNHVLVDSFTFEKKTQKKYFGWFQAHLYWFNHIVNLLFLNHLSIFASYKLQGIFQHVFDDTSWVSWTQWTPQLLHLFTIHTYGVAGGLRHQAHLPWSSSSLPKWRRDATRGRASERCLFRSGAATSGAAMG